MQVFPTEKNHKTQGRSNFKHARGEISPNQFPDVTQQTSATEKVKHRNLIYCCKRRDRDTEEKEIMPEIEDSNDR